MNITLVKEVFIPGFQFKTYFLIQCELDFIRTKFRENPTRNEDFEKEVFFIWSKRLTILTPPCSSLVNTYVYQVWWKSIPICAHDKGLKIPLCPNNDELNLFLIAYREKTI